MRLEGGRWRAAHGEGWLCAQHHHPVWRMGGSRDVRGTTTGRSPAAGPGRDVLPGHARHCPGEKAPASPGQGGGGGPGHRPTRLDCSPGARPLPRITSPDPATPPHCGDSPYFRSAARPGCPQLNSPLPTGQRGCAEEPAGQADLPSRRRARAGRTLLSS